MDYKIEGHNLLVMLQDMLVASVINPAPQWTQTQIESLTKMYKAADKLLSMWNDSVVPTTSGYALVLGQRNRMIGQMTKIIVNIQMISQTIDDEGNILLSEIDRILEQLSHVILGMSILEDSA